MKPSSEHGHFPFLASILVVFVALWFAIPVAYNAIEVRNAYMKQSFLHSSLDAATEEKIWRHIRDSTAQITKGDKNGNPTYAQQYLAMGIDLETLGQMRGAISAYEHARAEDPKSFVPSANLGTAYATIGDYERAVKEFRVAIDLQQDEYSSYTKLAEVYQYKFKDLDRARGVYIEGLMRTNNNPNILKAFATFLDETGAKSESLLYWQALGKILPGDQGVRDRLKELMPSAPKPTSAPASTKPTPAPAKKK